MKHTTLVLIGILLLKTAFTQVTIDHVEPPCWWAGMKNNSLQLMIHGNNIGKTKPSLEYNGVKIKDVANAGDDYLFVDLVIGNSAKPGFFTISFKEKELEVASSQYELKARLEGSAKRAGFNT